MGQLVLLVVAAAWAAVLVPPLLRSRIENRPNSSVTDFANQLSSLQRAMPTRGVAMRSMSRPLAPSPLSRPAATGRPALRSGVRTHTSPTAPARPTPVRLATDRHPRLRRHPAASAAMGRGRRRTPPQARNAVKRRRANVLFVLALIAGCSLFLAATTKAQALLWFSCAAFAVLCVYVYVLGQLRQREAYAPPRPVARQLHPEHAAHRRSEVHRHERRHGRRAPPDGTASRRPLLRRRLSGRTVS